jgi:hypothetical protein
MLDQALAGQGYPASTPDTADPEHACDTVKPGYGTLGVNLQDGQSYNSHLGDAKQTQEGHVRNRRAVLSKGILQTSAGCEVSMEVKPNSRAIVDAALSSGTLDQACTDARKLAEEVDLLLPKSS